MTQINRELLLSALRIASVGCSAKEVLEQSNCFIFTNDSLITFNGEILVRAKNPFPEEIVGAVPAKELLAILGKMPDEEITVSQTKSEIRIKGARRMAGIVLQDGISLPYSDVPNPKGWARLPESIPGALRQAACVCGKDLSQPMTTDVHVTPEFIEACDNLRLFRYQEDTGFSQSALIPASSIAAVGDLDLTKVCQTEGWVHFRVGAQARVSIRCSAGDYPNIEKLLRMKNPQKVILPQNLADILSRAEVMQDSSYDAIVSISISGRKLKLRSERESGWYQESKAIKYDGPTLQFSVHPKILRETVEKTKRVQIANNRLRIKSGQATFIVCLETSE